MSANSKSVMTHYLIPLLLIVVALVQPVQAKLVGQSDVSTSHYSSSEVKHVDEGTGKHLVECHSGHVIAILDNAPAIHSNCSEIAPELGRISDYSFIISEDPPPPKA